MTVKTINANSEISIGDYYFAGKHKRYIVHIKEISKKDQRVLDPEEGECKCPLFRVDIYNRNLSLLAEDSIITYDHIKNGNLKWLIPNLNYGPSYMGRMGIEDHPREHKLWRDMISTCYNPNDSSFPFIGAMGTKVCDKWLCFEYFMADVIHIAGYKEFEEDYANHYIIDILDKQKHIHPSERIYGPGLVKIKKFKYSDICKYKNTPRTRPHYPCNQYATAKYMRNMIPMCNLYMNRTGLNYQLDLNTANFYTDLDHMIYQGVKSYVTGGTYNGVNELAGRDLCKIRED